MKYFTGIIVFLTILFLSTSSAQDTTKRNIGKGQITDIAYSPDGTHFIVNGRLFYDAVTYQELPIEDSPNEWLSPNKQVRVLVVSLAGYRSAKFYDVNTGTLLNEITTNKLPQPDIGGLSNSQSLKSTERGWVVCTVIFSHLNYSSRSYGMAFSADGHILAVGSKDSTQFYDVDTGGKLLRSLPIPGPISKHSLSPDGQILVSRGPENNTQLWRVETGILLHTFTPLGQSNLFMFSPDGQTLALWDSTLQFYDVETGTLLRTFTLGGGYHKSIVFSPDWQTFVSLSVAGEVSIKLRDTNTGRILRAVAPHSRQINEITHRFPVMQVVFSPDGQTLASSGYDGSICFIDVNTFRKLHTITGFIGDALGERSVAFSPDSQMLARVNGLTLNLYDADTGEHLRMLLGHGTTITSVAFSPDGQTLASGDHNNFIRLWDVNTGQTLHVFKANANNVRSVAFSPDGQTLASASGSYNTNLNIIELWDVNTGDLLQTFRGHTFTMSSVAFSPDGQMIASGSQDSTTRLWDVNTGTLLYTLKSDTLMYHKVYSVAFSPDGQTLASGDDVGVHLWDVNTGTLLRTLFKATVESVAFSPDGQTLASRSFLRFPNNIHFWDVNTGALLHMLTGGWSNVTFSPDGKDFTAGRFLWDVASILPISELLPEDVNADGVVNIQDLVSVANDFGESCFFSGIGLRNDVNKDGVVNIQDLVKVANAMGRK